MIKSWSIIVKIKNLICSSTISYMFVGVCLLSFSYSEEVCKFQYNEQPEHINGSVLPVAEDAVAMSEYVPVGDASDIYQEGGPGSILFVIDNSHSMFSIINGDGFDIEGARFTVTSEIIDAIYSMSPASEVGICVFASNLGFDPNDDTNFKTATGDFGPIAGAYIPLTQLNEDAGTGQDGIDYLKDYMKVKKYPPEDRVPNEYWNLVYRPSDASLFYGWFTSYYVSFSAAKCAFKDAKYSKPNHYIIFISDGTPTKDPLGFIWDKEEAAKDLPTIFFVYCDPNASSLVQGKLDDLITNVKNNGYSTSNGKSNKWSFAIDHDVLLKHLMENVINDIITNVLHYTPENLTVNSISPISPWDGTGFEFKNLFPLIDVNTSFDYDITYHITMDSIVGNDTISVDIKDTSVSISYTAEIRSGVQESDTVDFIYWGRNLEFYYNGSKIDEAEGSMEELEIRFTEYEVDILYGYEDAPVEITHVQGTSQDVENFELDDNGDYFSYKFSREIGNPSSGDGTLQHQNPDSIVAVFRNPKLLLDTLRITIPFYVETNVLVINKAVYYDNNADGKVDSVYVDVSGIDFEDYIDEIMDEIELPEHRDFEVSYFEEQTGGIGITVLEHAPEILTYVTSDDVIEIEDSVEVGEDVFLAPCKIKIIDSIAPIIMYASLIDSADEDARDELTVGFSEDVEEIDEDRPFKFYSIDEDEIYDAELRVLSQTGDLGVFEVISVEGVDAIVHGDSIRINWNYDENVYDEPGNNQDNPGNIRREIKVTVVEEGLKVYEGIYFDNNADGHVDSLYIRMYGEEDLINKHLSDIVDLIELPDHRDFRKGSFAYDGNGICLSVEEGSDEIRTYVTDRDVLIVEKKEFPDSTLLLASEVEIIDSIAPVIMKASLIDSVIYVIKGNTILKTDGGRDELTVEFSEDVEEITREKPFKFYSIDEDKRYNVTLSRIVQNDEVGEFEVKEIDGVDFIEDGDSIRIFWKNEKNVYDVLGNNQDNPENIRREIDVAEVCDTVREEAPFELILKATLLDYRDIGLMHITLEPDSIENVSEVDEYSAVLDIYDALGNEILNNKDMEPDNKRKRLIYVWDGTNKKGRNTGPGGYVLRAKISRSFNNKKKPDDTRTITVGVKE